MPGEPKYTEIGVSLSGEPDKFLVLTILIILSIYCDHIAFYLLICSLLAIRLISPLVELGSLPRGSEARTALHNIM